MSDYKEINVFPNLSKVEKIVKAQISVIELQLYKSVTVRVILLNEDDRIVDIKQFVIDETNGYNDWGNSDDFIVEWIQRELKIGKYA